MSDSIRISEKHGVNPSVLQCALCAQDYGVALFGRLPNDEEAPRRICHPGWICDRCKEDMKKGFLLIECQDGSDPHNPFRTGRTWVITMEAAERVGVAFIEESMAKSAGLHEVGKQEF